jgi:hypothetical protein
MTDEPQRDTIILVRHGKPALSRKVRLTWREFRDWWVRYDEGGIKPGQKPPKKVIQWAHKADFVVSSSLRRSIESAELAAGRAPDRELPGLVEAALPSPPLGPLKLRPKSWGTVARILWYVGYSDGMESHTEARTVYVSGHGWFNRMVKGSLMARGWRCKSQNGDLHWSRRRMVRPTHTQEDST